MLQQTAATDNRSGGNLLVFGCAPDTRNHGVTALMTSVVAGLAERAPHVRITIADHGRGVRDGHSGGHAIGLVGVRATRRLYAQESAVQIEWAARLGGLGNPAAEAMLAADAILDISGGDSFTDLYGARRFGAITWPKRMAIRMRKPLILLPQTYGPFRDPRARREAASLARASRAAWARDARSFEVLRDLLGDAFDPSRHRLGVDVAFGLPTVRPGNLDGTRAAEWLEEERDWPLLGLNVSGLIWNSGDGGRSRFAMRADYRQAVVEFLRRALEASDCRVLLVPHVVTEPGHFESDIQACQEAAAALGNDHAERVLVAPTPEGPCDAKWMIARCDWFCGTRMHATIAALSSGVPAAAVSYSDKTLGVFETCGQGEHVHDPRVLEADELVERVVASWEQRAAARASLAVQLTGLLAQAGSQMDGIASTIERSVAENLAC